MVGLRLNTVKHSETLKVLKMIFTQPLVVNHLPKVCQSFCPGTNGYPSGSDHGTNNLTNILTNGSYERELGIIMFLD